MAKEENESQIISLESLMANTPIDEKGEEERLNEDLEKSLKNEKESTDLVDQYLEEEGISTEEEVEEVKDVETDEPVEEGNQEEGEEETPSQEEPEPNNFYKDTVKELFGEDQMFIQEDEDGNEVEVSIDDLDVDASTFKQLIENKIDSEKEKALEGKISSEGISDITKDLIEIDRNGGSIRDLLEYKDAYTDPLDSIDLTSEQGQIAAIELYLRGRQEPEDEISLRIDAYKKNGLLEEKAKQFDSSIRESVKALTEKRKEEALEQKKQREELFKKYRKDLGEQIKSKFDMKESVRKRLVDNATKKEEDGEYRIDKLYKQARSNPEDMALLSLFFEDREEFFRQTTSKDLNKRRLQDQKAIRIGAKSNNKFEGSKKGKDPKKSNVISFEELGI